MHACAFTTTYIHQRAYERFLLQASQTQCPSRCLRLLKSQRKLMHNVFGACHSSLVSASLSLDTVSRRCEAIYSASTFECTPWAYCGPTRWLEKDEREVWSNVWPELAGPDIPRALYYTVKAPPLPCLLTSLSLVATPLLLVDFLLEPSESNHSLVTLSDTGLIGRHCICSRWFWGILAEISPWPLRAILFGPLCFHAVCVDCRCKINPVEV